MVNFQNVHTVYGTHADQATILIVFVLPQVIFEDWRDLGDLGHREFQGTDQLLGQFAAES